MKVKSFSHFLELLPTKAYTMMSRRVHNLSIYLPCSFRIVFTMTRKGSQKYMDWNSKILRSAPFDSCPNDSFTNFLCNSNFHPFHVLEVKQYDQGEILAPCPQNMERSPVMQYGNYEKRNKRLTTDQLESLENSFQVERKLEPCRKMKLAKELGLEPRQVAVWFQNRRARWKAKKVEHLYDTLKHDYAVVLREKQKLQDEVVRLKSMLMEVNKGKQVTVAYKEVSEIEQVESTKVEAQRCKKHEELSEGISKFDQFNEANHLYNNVNYFGSLPPHYLGAYS